MDIGGEEAGRWRGALEVSRPCGGAAVPRRTAQQRRLYVTLRASLPLSALLRTELEGAYAAPSRLSQGLPSPGAPCPPPSLPSPKRLVGLGHGNDSLICRLKGGFKDYEW